MRKAINLAHKSGVVKPVTPKVTAVAKKSKVSTPQVKKVSTASTKIASSSGVTKARTGLRIPTSTLTYG